MKELSVFIDESGDLGSYNKNNEFYIVSLVFHEQENDITSQVNLLDEFLIKNNLLNQAIHTAPLIRREKNYKIMDIGLRNKIFKKLFNFAKNVDISYKTIIVEKKYTKERLSILRNIANELFGFISENFSYFKQFDNVIVYYDGGQTDLIGVINTIFGTILKNNFEYRAIMPIDYKLFQSADLFCTLALIKAKINQGKSLTKSETLFFGSIGKFRKNYLKTFEKIEFGNKNNKIKLFN